MISLKKLWRDKRGNVLAIAAAALPLVIGSAGLASDTIQWTLWKRQLQRAADSAALAGVYAKVEDNASQTVSGAVDTDLDKNDHTGITLLGSPTITNPTSSEWTNGVRVQIALQKRLGFSSLFMSSPPVIRADATAATVATGVYCVVSLVDTAATGIKASGNGTVDLGCGMITNSNSLSAAIATGSSSVVATPIAAVGDVQESDNWGDAELLPFTVKQKDPFKDVNPTTSGCPTTNKINVGPSGSAAISPGCFTDISINGPVTLNPGTYIIDGGNVSFGAKANVTCTGCTFVLTNSSTGSTATIGQLTTNASAQLNLSAPTTGCSLGNAGCYDSILFYQDRRADSSASGKNIINGNSDSIISGAFYFPKQELQVNGTATLHFACAQFVSYTVDFSGNGTVSNTCSGYGDKEIMGKHVRLVA
jgi:Flp pilus assembly protein TadG